MSERVRRLLVLVALFYLVAGTIASILRVASGDIDMGMVFLVGTTATAGWLAWTFRRPVPIA